jgi:Putative transposase
LIVTVEALSLPSTRAALLPGQFLAFLKKRFVVYAKPPFSGPEAVLAYLSRYTHRVAVSNQRLIAFYETGVTFRYKDYRRDGPERQRVMTLAPHGFIRRFLLHVLPRGFHRIRHYGQLASSARKANIARAREPLAVTPPPEPVDLNQAKRGIPIDQRRRPAGSCMGGFRTPDGNRKPSPIRSSDHLVMRLDTCDMVTVMKLSSARCAGRIID